MTVDPHRLQRFLDAQNGVYAQVLSELRAGEKQTHWMWFVFPQILGLGSSPTAQKFAIENIDEAKTYLNHAVLGARILECTQLVNAIRGRSIEDIFAFPDNLKFHSCMTLFAQVSEGAPDFAAALNKYFNGQKDRKTLALL